MPITISQDQTGRKSADVSYVRVFLTADQPGLLEQAKTAIIGARDGKNHFPADTEVAIVNDMLTVKIFAPSKEEAVAKVGGAGKLGEKVKTALAAQFIDANIETYKAVAQNKNSRQSQ